MCVPRCMRRVLVAPLVQAVLVQIDVIVHGWQPKRAPLRSFVSLRGWAAA